MSRKPSPAIIILSTTALTLASSGGGAAEDAYVPVDQAGLNAMITSRGGGEAFDFAFEAGDELTEFSFKAENGVGANVGEGRRFARFPRPDLKSAEEWSTHFPKREGGPNATSCIACHNMPIANGAGDISSNVLVDPAHTGDPARFLERNTLPLMGLAISQRLAEEMSEDLYAQRDAIREKACEQGAAKGRLVAKGVAFGSASAFRMEGEDCRLVFDWSDLDGVDEDLIVRAFGWKGNHATIRAFTRGAAHNELGLQAVELVGAEDGDFDGVSNELTVGDMTALSVYMAALERPVTRIELADLGLIELPDDDRARINAGEEMFQASGCAACHVPEMTLSEPMFSEPSQTPGFFETAFPSGSKPSDHALLREMAIWFDMRDGQPNNRITLASGAVEHLGGLPRNPDGSARAQWFTDLKRHDMGEALADPDDPLGIGASVWLTRSLAGTGSTGPWLHDGRATSLDEAIMAHGGDARASRERYASRPESDREAIVAFLENLVIYKHDGEDD